MTRKGALVLVAAVSALGGTIAGLAAGREADRPAAGPAGAREQVAQVQRSTAALPGEGRLSVRAETRRAVGTFAVRGGRRIALRTLETTDGLSCLVDVDEASGSGGSVCFPGRLFARSPVLWSISLDGGPERFSGLYLAGAAAPTVARIEVEKSDGTVARTEPNASGGFLVESSAEELARDVFPSALRVYGRGGRLLAEVDIPAPR